MRFFDQDKTCIASNRLIWNLTCAGLSSGVLMLVIVAWPLAGIHRELAHHRKVQTDMARLLNDMDHCIADGDSSLDELLITFEGSPFGTGFQLDMADPIAVLGEGGLPSKSRELPALDAERTELIAEQRDRFVAFRKNHDSLVKRIGILNSEGADEATGSVTAVWIRMIIAGCFCSAVFVVLAKRMAQIHSRQIQAIDDQARALTERHAHVQLLQDVAVSANESSSVEATLKFVLDRICEDTGWPIGHAYLRDKTQGGELRSAGVTHCEASVCSDKTCETLASATFGQGDRLVGRVLQTRMPSWNGGGTKKHPLLHSRLDDGRTLQAAFAFPVRVNGEVAAVLEFYSAEHEEPDDRLMQIVAHAGSQLGQVIERQHAATQQKQLQCELAHAQKLESVGQLAAGIAHEINTPTQYVGDNTRFLKDAFVDLSTVLDSFDKLLHAAKDGSADEQLVADVEEVLRQADLEYLTEEIPQAIDQSLDGVGRVAKIVRAMKEFSHPGVEEKSHVNLTEAIETTITVARSEWKYVAEVVTEFESELPDVCCLPGELNQVFLNLVVNATHAIADKVGDDAAEKGTITLATRRDGEWIEIIVRDTGTGIPETVRAKIFDPFFTTKEVGKGTGQGLAIARSVVVDKHGGTIDCETKLGAGTTFTVRLPIDGDAEPHGTRKGYQDACSIC